VNLAEKSEELVLDKNTENGDAHIAEVSRPATTPAPRSKSEFSNGIKTDTPTDEAAEALTAEGTSDAANTRRGLRNRKPAQQRPYYHDAQVFEEVETEQEDESEPGSSSRGQSPEAPPPSKPKHFKGKGRAWKKDDSDEDEEFVTPKEKKAAKVARAKAEREKARVEKEANDNGTEGDITSALMDLLDADQTILIDRLEQTNGSPKDSLKHKTTKNPRKSSLLSEDLGSENNTSQATPTRPPKRGRGRPRKSALSSEIVRDDSDDDAETPARAAGATDTNAAVNFSTPPIPKSTSRPSTATSTAPATTPRKRGRPRKSESITTPVKSSAKTSEDPEEAKQRLDSTAAEATEPKESVPAARPTADYPTPMLNRGAALVESLYPRDPKSEAARAPSASAPTATTAAAAAAAPAVASQPTTAQPEPAASTETQPAQAAAQTPALDADADTNANPIPERDAHTQAAESAAVPTPPPPSKNEVKNERAAEIAVEADDAHSVAMSLGSSSDTEL